MNVEQHLYVDLVTFNKEIPKEKHFYAVFIKRLSCKIQKSKHCYKTNLKQDNNDNNDDDDDDNNDADTNNNNGSKNVCRISNKRNLMNKIKLN